MTTDWEFAPSAINDAARLFFDVRKDFGAEVLDNPECFDQVFGAGRFAVTDRSTLDVIRRCIEDAPDHIVRLKRRKVEKIEQECPNGD